MKNIIDAKKIKSLDIKNLSVNYGNKNVIKDLNVTINAGELTALIGNNGCGKSTFLKAVMNLISHKGKCLIKEVDSDTDLCIEHMSAKKLAAYISYIAQTSGISSSMSVLDVCMMGYNPHLPLLSNPTALMKNNAEEILWKIGLGERVNEDFLTLSEGQKQLCILARSIVQHSPIMFLDEPESALDITNRYELMRIVRSLINENTCAVMCIHSPELALEYCDRILFMQEGNIVEDLYIKNADINSLNKAFSRLYNGIEITESIDSKGRKHYFMYPV